ncbi:hypothetical protein DB345_06255 [Spartobacteria bacterium LR76]|nr:hypothetical protein DB345_06255 [Spartobacteria bacterium LR76]
MKLPVLLAVVLASCSAPVLALDAVVEETFTAPLDAGKWVIPTNFAPSSSQGRLVWKMDGWDEGRDSVVGLRLRNPLDKLNFVRTPIRLSLADIAISGGEKPEGVILMLILASNQSAEQLSDSFLKLRIDGSGKVAVTMPGMTKTGEKGDRTLLQTQVALPIRSLALELDEHLVRLSVEDAKGSDIQETGWKNILSKEVWQDASPFLILKAVRKAGPGTPEISIGKLDITEL